jgi:hypothetical protein
MATWTLAALRFYGKVGAEGCSRRGACIQASDEPAPALAERFGTTEQATCKWKHRSTVHDRNNGRVTSGPG